MDKPKNTIERSKTEQLLVNIIRSRHPSYTLFFPVGNGRSVELPLLNISYIEAQGVLSVVHLDAYKTKVFRVGKSIGDCESQLNAFAFVRIHRKYLVNSSWIKAIKRKDGQWHCLINENILLPISRRQQKHVFDQLSDYGIERSTA